MNRALAVAKTTGNAAINYGKAHPYQTAFVAANVGLAPILGPGWLIAMPLHGLGFGSGGVVGGIYVLFQIYSSKVLTSASEYRIDGGWVPINGVRRVYSCWERVFNTSTPWCRSLMDEGHG